MAFDRKNKQKETKRLVSSRNSVRLSIDWICVVDFGLLVDWIVIPPDLLFLLLFKSSIISSVFNVNAESKDANYGYPDEYDCGGDPGSEGNHVQLLGTIFLFLNDDHGILIVESIGERERAPFGVLKDAPMSVGESA